MIAIRRGWSYRKVTISIDVIEMYMGLGHSRLKVDKDLLRLLNLPFVSKKDKKRLEKEIADTSSSYSLNQLKEWGYEMGVKDYSSLSPVDLEKAYCGYNSLICALGNLYIVAQRKSEDKDAEPFDFKTEEVSREETFKIIEKMEEN